MDLQKVDTKDKKGSPGVKSGEGKLFFQPKLTINQPNDSYEHEADAMADKVMRMSDSSGNSHVPFFKPVTNTIQRKCQHCEEEEKLHRKENSAGEIQGSNELDNYVSSLNTSGQPLSQASRSFFEPRFGHDFSGVRVHTDSVAAKSAQSINALAYTTGNNIVFNSGQFLPDSDSGKRLMAHELTHVVQQNYQQVQKKTDDKTKDCASYEKGEVEQSHKEDGLLADDIIEPGNTGLIIQDFGVDYRHIKDRTRKSKALTDAIKQLEEDTTYKRLSILGYSDCVGSERNNIYLRKWRAKNVFDLLGKKARAKVDSITDAPIGEYITGNTTKEDRAANRSVIIKYGRDFTFSPDTIEAESCANPQKAQTISDYIQLIACLESEHSKMRPREILSLIRQLSYGGELFSQAIPCEINVGDPKKIVSPKLYSALHEHEITQDVVDIGHVFTGLEAMICPSDKVTITKYYIDVDTDISNEEFVTWAGDLGSAVAHKIKDEEVDNLPPKDIGAYFGNNSVAGFDDMNGDIDAYVIRAGLNNINCAGSPKQPLAPLQDKISDILRDYYLGNGAGKGKATVNTRYSCFIKVLGADVGYGNITGNMIDLRDKITVRTYRFAKSFFMKIGGAYKVSAPGMDILFKTYSRQMADQFIQWLNEKIKSEQP